MQARMDNFKAQLDEFEAKLRLFSQGVQTLRSNITNLSTDFDRLQRIYVERIVEESDNVIKAAQIKADLEKATELEV
jgi:multidrug resistance efflux pump